MMRLDYQERQLSDLFKSVETIKDEEIKSHMTKYLCIQTSGYLENVVKTLIDEYLENSCPKPAKDYINSKVGRLTNLDEEKLGKFLRSFSLEWLQIFNEKVNDKQKASLNSIISNRNQIAHGKSIGLTYVSIHQYYIDLQQIIIVLKSIIKKNTKRR